MFASFGHNVLILPYLVMAWLFSSMLYSEDCDGIKYDTSSTIIFLSCISTCSPIGEAIVHNKGAQCRHYHRSVTSHLIWYLRLAWAYSFFYALENELGSGSFSNCNKEILSQYKSQIRIWNHRKMHQQNNSA